MRILYLFFVFSFIASFAFAELPSQRIQIEPASKVSISTVRCGTSLLTIPSLRGRKEISIRNIEAANNVYIFVSPNTVDFDGAWEVEENVS